MLVLTILAVPFGVYVFCLACWLFYQAIMNLKPHRKTLRPFAKANAYVLVFVGYIIDILLNAIVGTLVFLDPPREMLFTSRVKRYIHGDAAEWRKSLALWICAELLSQFDPSGDHCGSRRKL